MLPVELVSSTADCDYQLLALAVSEFLSQPRDVHINGPRVGNLVVSPHRVEQLVTVQHGEITGLAAKEADAGVTAALIELARRYFALQYGQY